MPGSTEASGPPTRMRITPPAGPPARGVGDAGPPRDLRVVGPGSTRGVPGIGDRPPDWDEGRAGRRLPPWPASRSDGEGRGVMSGPPRRGPDGVAAPRVPGPAPRASG